MEKKVKLVCIIVGILGVLATATGFAAEAKRVKQHQIRYLTPNGCIYPRTPAVALGLTAVVALTIAQTILNIATDCLCCRRRTFPLDFKQTVAQVCYTMSWFTFIVAFLMLLLGSAVNDKKAEETGYFNDFYCTAARSGIFTMGAILSLATVILGILAYASEESSKNRGDPWSPSVVPEQPGIAMGQARRSQDGMFFQDENYQIA
ncbi:protein VASCULATURE COMPLEXITY AND CONNECTIVITY-like [Apium graveolens]|uniref:protein VASCULATURE COMPLEXITY AND CONNECTIVITY-like n=1 Tax=Apium graveolens TaxID=4045 RepID=UPI003D7B3854